MSGRGEWRICSGQGEMQHRAWGRGTATGGGIRVKRPRTQNQKAACSGPSAHKLIDIRAHCREVLIVVAHEQAPRPKQLEVEVQLDQSLATPARGGVGWGWGITIGRAGSGFRRGGRLRGGGRGRGTRCGGGPQEGSEGWAHQEAGEG